MRRLNPKETREERSARYAAYQARRESRFAKRFPVLLTKEDGARFDVVLKRRGAKKGPFTSALISAALNIEEAGGDSIRALEAAQEQLAPKVEATK